MWRRLLRARYLLTRMAHSGQSLNRLANERSPYLLQHATNPVDWYPWGEEAFEVAKKENKLIFLSIGYSTCHWCHVMERESFENQEVADILNKHFVSIKVDREERPDIDQIYMTYVQVTSGSGGWPLSLWLTPTLKPVLGGTYFPPEDHVYGRSGFKTILRKIQERWQSPDSDKLIANANRITDNLANASNFRMNEQAVDSFDVTHVVEKCYSMLRDNFEDVSDRHEPKFPQCVISMFLLNLYNFNRDLGAPALVHKQLRAMATGGIHDHLAGGFHRYSVDSKWHVPHFEKMLYDQAQILELYSFFSKISTVQRRDVEFYVETAKNIADYVCRDLSHPEGGFYSAEDADSLEKPGATEKKEGAFYVWTHDEIEEVLDEQEKKIFCEFFAIEEQGNVEPSLDPHGELLNQNVLIYRYRDWIDLTESETAKIFDLGTDVNIKDILESAKEKLLKRRLETRPRPHLDNKIVTAWNGLMIAGMAKAHRFLDQPEYGERALKAKEFVKKYLYTSDKTLLRSVYTESDEALRIEQLATPISGVVDDYAFLIHGLLELYDATLDEESLLMARDLQTSQDRLFYDEKNGGYFLSANDSSKSDIIFKIKDDQDGAEPSANSVSVANLVRLAAIFDDEELRKRASTTLRLFAERLNKVPFVLPGMVSSLLLHSREPTKVVLSSPNDDVTFLKSCCDSEVRPFLLVFKAHDGSLLGYDKKSYMPVNGKTTAYVCKGTSCRAPVTEEGELLELLSE